MEQTQEDLMQNVCDETTAIAVNSIRKMQELWSQIFEKNTCNEYLIKLPDHIQIYFEEVYEESKERKAKIEEAIAELYEEASELKRLLNVEMQLSPQNGVPLHTAQINLDRSLQYLRDKLKHRHDQINEYLLDQETLCEELGENPKELRRDPLPTETELNEFQIYLEELKIEKLNRLDEIAALRKNIKKMMNQLEINIQNDWENELLNAREFLPTKQNLCELKSLHENVCQQFEDIKLNIDKIKLKLDGLWTYLQVSPTVIKKFSKYNEYTQTIYDKLFTELDRCETLRRENIHDFVDRTRADIRLWWEKCLKSDEERARFSTFNSDVYNEDLLTLHEMELNDLKEFYETNQNIFELVEQRRQMWDKMRSLEDKSNDADRYKNRGGKLLDEEKERKVIGIKLPKIETKLLELCQTYEEQHKRKFTVFGKDIKEIINADWKRREDGKMLLSSARKKANLGTPNPKITITVTRTPNSVNSVKQSTSISRTRAGDTLLKASSAFKVSRTMSTTALSASKRKLSPPKNDMHAKRSLLRDLNSPATFLKPGPVSKSRLIAKSPLKVPSKRIYETGTLKKRRSRTKSRASSGQKTNRKSNANNLTQINLSTNPILSDSVSYDLFENFLEKNSPNRSSIMPAGTRSKCHLTGSRTKAFGTPRSTSRIMSSTTTTAIPSPSPSRSATKKLTTKNLPIII